MHDVVRSQKIAFIVLLPSPRVQKPKLLELAAIYDSIILIYNLFSFLVVSSCNLFIRGDVLILLNREFIHLYVIHSDLYYKANTIK